MNNVFKSLLVTGTLICVGQSLFAGFGRANYTFKNHSKEKVTIQAKNFATTVNPGEEKIFAWAMPLEKSHHFPTHESFSIKIGGSEPFTCDGSAVFNVLGGSKGTSLFNVPERVGNVNLKVDKNVLWGTHLDANIIATNA